jgi:hypothetical protein
LVLALEPIAGGSRRVPLDEAERSAVLQANAVRFDAQLPELVSTFVACHSFYPAGLMVLTCLSRRNGLDQELSAALEAADPELRLSALQFLRHVPELPAGAEIGPLRVLRSFLNSQRTDSEECLELVRVLSRVPERITAYRMEVAHLRELARQDSRRTARKVRYETQELLRRIDLELEQRDGRVAAATAVLRALVLRGDFDEAKAWLARCETLGGVHELLGRAHLSEAAGDRVASERPPAAEWLYERAQESFDRYAALSPSGEGRARSRHVRRVALKLARLRGLAPSAPENSEQDSWLPPPIQPAATANADDFE